MATVQTRDPPKSFRTPRAMTDAERIALARRFFERLAAKFLALPSQNGSFTVHYQNGIPKTVEWRGVESADKWDVA